jgi:hypothetical protein
LQPAIPTISFDPTKGFRRGQKVFEKEKDREGRKARCWQGRDEKARREEGHEGREKACKESCKESCKEIGEEIRKEDRQEAVGEEGRQEDGRQGPEANSYSEEGREKAGRR